MCLHYSNAEHESFILESTHFNGLFRMPQQFMPMTNEFTVSNVK